MQDVGIGQHVLEVGDERRLEQVIIMGQGAHRMSAPGLKEEVELALKELRGEHLGRQVNLKNYLLDYLDEETAKQMEEIRLGKEKC